MAALAAIVVRRSCGVSHVAVRCWNSGTRVAGRRNFSPMAWYNQKLESSPIITKSITSGSEFGLHLLMVAKLA